MQNSSCFLEKVKRCTSTKLTVKTDQSLHPQKGYSGAGGTREEEQIFCRLSQKEFPKWYLVREKVRAAEVLYPVNDGFSCHLPIVASKQEAMANTQKA